MKLFWFVYFYFIFGSCFALNVEISKNEVLLDSHFDGDYINVFGSSSDGSLEKIAVVVVDSEKEVSVLKKVEKFGMYLPSGGTKFFTHRFYQAVLSPGSDVLLIDYKNQMTCNLDGLNADFEFDFQKECSNVLRMQAERKGLFMLDGDGVKISADKKFFNAKITLPSSIVPGSYFVFVLSEDVTGESSDVFVKSFKVLDAGFVSKIYQFFGYNKLILCLFVCVFSIIFGVVTHFIFSYAFCLRKKI